MQMKPFPQISQIGSDGKPYPICAHLRNLWLGLPVHRKSAIMSFLAESKKSRFLVASITISESWKEKEWISIDQLACEETFSGANVQVGSRNGDFQRTPLAIPDPVRGGVSQRILAAQFLCDLGIDLGKVLG